jgi:hypothetical protein
MGAAAEVAAVAAEAAEAAEAATAVEGWEEDVDGAEKGAGGAVV